MIAEHVSIATVGILPCTQDQVKLLKADSLAVDSNGGTNQNDPPKPRRTNSQFLCFGPSCASAHQLHDVI